MLFCNNCGQCSFISNDQFIEYANVGGTETRYLDPENGEVVDYGDSDIEGTGESTHECPHCGDDSINWDWDGDIEDALEVREIYDENARKLRENREKSNKLAKAQESMKKSGWDIESNEAFN